MVALLDSHMMVETGGTRNRPVRVTIIGILSILAGLIYLFPVLGIYDSSNFINLTGQTFHSGPLVLTAFVIAMANFILGAGCLFGWRPIWFYLVVISVVNFIVALIAFRDVDMDQTKALLISVLWLGFATYVLIIVHSKKTKKWFHQ